MKKLLLTILLLGIIILAGCNIQPEAEEDTQEDLSEYTDRLPVTERDFDIGVAGLVPEKFPRSEEAEWIKFYNSISDTGELLGVYVEWDDTQIGGIPEQVHLAFNNKEEFEYTPVIALGFEAADDEFYFLDQGKEYRETALKVARTFKPEYLALGVETNKYYEASPEGFEVFVRQYKDTYDAIKEASPETKVFTIFQLEYMKGEATLSGEEHEAHWEIIEQFEDKLDIVGFTTYPFLDEYEGPQEMPAGYYAEIAEYTDKPIAFTEMGWISKEEFTNALSRLNGTPFVGSEQEQVDFLLKFLDETQTLNLEMAVWTLPHDLRGESQIFNFVALRENNGNEKEVLQYWKALVGLNQQD